MICLELNWFDYYPSWMHLSEFVDAMFFGISCF